MGILHYMYRVLFPGAYCTTCIPYCSMRALFHAHIKYCKLEVPLATCIQCCSLNTLWYMHIVLFEFEFEFVTWGHSWLHVQSTGHTELHENEAVSWALFTICQQNCSIRYRWLHICSIVPWGYPSIQVYRIVSWGYAAIYAYGIIPRGHPLIQLSNTVTRGNPCLHVFSAFSWMHTALHVDSAVRIMGIHTT